MKRSAPVASEIWNRLVHSRTDRTTVQFVRSLVVGAIATLVDMTILVCLTEVAGLHYLHSAAVGFLVGISVNYFFSILWVFDSRKLHSKAAEFVIFSVLGVTGLGINQLFMYLVTDIAGGHYVISKCFATCVTFVWNFWSRKALLFSRRAERRPPRVLQTVRRRTTVR